MSLVADRLLESQDLAEILTSIEDGVWNEDGDTVWLLRSNYRSASHARYCAWKGEGLPTSFRDWTDRFIDLKVKVVFMRPSYNFARDEPWWEECGATDPNRRRFYKVTA